MHVRVYVSFAFSFLSSLLPTRALVTLTCQHHPSFSNNFPLFSLSPAPPNPPIKSPTLVCAAASEALDLHSQQSPPVSPQTSAQCKASPEAAAAILCLVNPLLTYEAAADVVASNGTNINPERREIGKEEEKEEGGEDIAGVSPPLLDANARELLADANTKLVKAAAISRQYYGTVNLLLRLNSVDCTLPFDLANRS